MSNEGSGNRTSKYSQWPDAWVVRVDLKHYVSKTLHHLGIAPLWIARVDYSSIPSTYTFGEDEHVVAMYMHRMCRRYSIINDKPDGMIAAEIIDVPLWVGRIRYVPFVGE